MLKLKKCWEYLQKNQKIYSLLKTPLPRKSQKRRRNEALYDILKGYKKLYNLNKRKEENFYFIYDTWSRSNNCYSMLFLDSSYLFVCLISLQIWILLILIWEVIYACNKRPLLAYRSQNDWFTKLGYNQAMQFKQFVREESIFFELASWNVLKALNFIKLITKSNF